jgi:hypothetical protein
VPKTAPTLERRGAKPGPCKGVQSNAGIYSGVQASQAERYSAVKLYAISRPRSSSNYSPENFSSKSSTDSTSTAAEMATINYSSLDRSRSEIRLLELLPKTMTSPYQGDLSPSCKFFHVSLNKNPQYMALSYTWGDPRGTQTIIIENTPVPVTRNLHSAMQRLRHDTNPKVIWIDALCIYSHRTTMKDLGILRFAPQFSEGFNFMDLASQSGNTFFRIFITSDRLYLPLNMPRVSAT